MDLQGQIQRLQRLLLSWDYFELADAEESGSSVVQELFDVPNIFDSMDHYTSVFGRLVLEECAAQMVRGVEESELILPHRALCDSASWADGDFLVAKLFLPPEDFARYMVNDLVLVCRRNPEEVSHPEEEVYAIAWVQGRDRPAHLVLRLFASDDAQAGKKEALMRITALRNIMLRSSREDNTWWLLRLANMATIMREWMAVFNAQYTPLADILLTAQRRRTASHAALDIPKRMHDALRSSFNPSQFQALTAGMNGSPLVLIQGPPGTGKTRTILGLLSVVMHMAEREQLGQAGDDDDGEDLAPSMGRLSQLWLAAAPWLEGATCNPRDQVTPDLDARCGEDCFGLLRRATPRRITTAKKRLAHILVCAPSNSALDEIASRLMQQGLLDAAGRPLSASIVRVGISYHHSVASVSLEHLLQQKLGADPSSFQAAERERVKGLILDEADIICSTLSFSGSGVFQRMTRRFDVVVVDEAAQAVEPSVLVPLLSGAKQVYMVGDPRQLPATVISTRATKHGYTTSLFKRLQMAGYPVQVLDTQYRMHPAISKFPSIMFYDSNLKDAPGVGSETMRPWHKCRAFAPFVVYDVQGKEEIPGGSSSLVNLKEAELLVALLLRLVAIFPAVLAGSHIGVVSPYKAQVKELRSRLKTALGENARDVDVNTIDGFQGREKDIILFSTVRSGAGRNKAIGFLADERRINVGLTRARSSLIVLGNTKALLKDDNWGGLVSWARTKKCLFKAAAPFRSFVEAMVEGSVAPEEVPALTKGEQAAAPESPAQGQQEKPKRPSKAASAAKVTAGKRSKR